MIVIVNAFDKYHDDYYKYFQKNFYSPFVKIF